MEAHFALGANVRFTRTPEVELVRRRGEDLPDINGRAKAVAPEASSTEVEKAAESQPMAVAALQQSVSQNMVRSPIAPVPPVVMAAPVAPVVQTVEVAPPVQAAVTLDVEPVSPVSNANVSAFALLSDFAFWESFDFDPAPAQPVVSVVPEAPKRPTPTVESIISQFRTVEWNKQKTEEVLVAAVAQPVVAEPAPQPVVAPVAEVKIEAPVVPEPVAVQVEAVASRPVVAKAPKVEEVVAIAEEVIEAEVVLSVAEEPIVEEVAEPAPVAAPAKLRLLLHFISLSPSPDRSRRHAWRL